MEGIYFVDRGSPAWDSMWAWLGRQSINEGLDQPTVAPDPEFGECIAACVATDLTEAELRAELGQRLAKFKIPRVFEILPALPREDPPRGEWA